MTLSARPAGSVCCSTNTSVEPGSTSRRAIGVSAAANAANEVNPRFPVVTVNELAAPGRDGTATSIVLLGESSQPAGFVNEIRSQKNRGAPSSSIPASHSPAVDVFRCGVFGAPLAAPTSASASAPRSAQLRRPRLKLSSPRSAPCPSPWRGAGHRRPA